MNTLSPSKPAEKAGLLLSLLSKRPSEVYDRLVTFMSGRLDRWQASPFSYEPIAWEDAVRGVEASLHKALGGFLDEKALLKITAEVQQGKKTRLTQAPFPVIHNADLRLARFCYAICRALNPAVVLETGVAYGVSSAFILQALEVNGSGELHSIDLPPLAPGADDFVGILVPQGLRGRWQLHRGTSQRVLPKLLPQLGRVDIFLHDSLHTYKNMKWEFEFAGAHLARPGVVLADDVEYNRAFAEWVGDAQPAFSATVKEENKDDILGVSVFL
jgi:predicted O-methyltransferase YrrM